ncbi:uncharacterized protein [Asterias amurensis]|uniref:uncharacterized protein n=1 Tax=Asterias amurensis TaxID=7602 RepID=UPI003AB15D18
MSRDWEHNFSSIVKETESNLAKVRQRLDVPRYQPRVATNNHTHTSFSSKPSTLPRNYVTSPTFATNGLSSYSNWRSQPHQKYQSLYSSQTSEGDSIPSTSTESPAMVAMLTEKIENQDKTIHALSRQVETMEREKDRTQTHLRRVDQELSSLSNRLQEGGVHLETERKVEGWKREVTLQLGDLQSQVIGQRRNATEGGYSDDVLNSLTREVHDFKRQMQEDLSVCRRELESLNSRLMRHEIDIANQQADGKDYSRRIDHLDRTLTSVCDSQRSHSREFNHSIHGRQTNDQEVLHLRSEMSRLMSTVDRLENQRPLIGSQRLTHEQPNLVGKNSSLGNNSSSAGNSFNKLSSSKDTSSKRSPERKLRSSRPHKLPAAHIRQVSDSDEFDVSLSLASSSSEDFSLDLPPHRAKNVQRNMYSTYPKDDENSDAFSEMTSALIDHDPTLDLVDLASTPSISSIEFDGDFL